MPDQEVIDQDQDLNADTTQLETRARDMGWRPKGEYQGDESKWVDASTYIERGEHVLPILKHTNERLRGDLTRTNQQLKELQDALKASQETISGLERYHQDDIKQKVEKARSDLKAQLVSAKKSGDVEAEVELTDELTRLNDAEATAADADNNNREEDRTKRPPPKDYTQEPDFISWKEANPWFGTDKARTAIAHGVSAELRASGNTTLGRAFLDKVAEETAKEVNRLAGSRGTNRVEGSRGGSGGSSGGNGRVKTYYDLPDDAKAACASYERDLVGPGRRFATKAEWQKKYTEDYFRDV